MKRNLHLILLLILALVGLAVFKISLSKSQAEVVQAEPLPVELSGYVNYSEAALAAALAKGKAVLFFAATTWCQTCSALEAEIIARASEIPAYTTILKVDYDNDKATNRKYAVTLQHTLIFLDQEGGEISRSVGDDFDKLLARL